MEASTEVKTAEERKAILIERIQKFARAGWRVESQSDYSVTIVKGHRPNHTLHLILSIITAGLWLIVWAVVSMTSKEHRRVLAVDERGEITG